jgi:hypothetical protein
MWKRNLRSVSVSFNMASGESPKVLRQTEDRAASALIEQWQQQQRSLLFQTSWGRLEIKPKTDKKQGYT